MRAPSPPPPQAGSDSGVDQLFPFLAGLNPHLQALVVAGTCLVGYQVFKLVVLGSLARVAAKTDNDLDDRLVHFARKFSVWIFVFFAVWGAAKVYGWDISPLLAGAGIAGIALGFAAKEVLADILAGVFLIADRPFRIGDRVKIERIGSDWGGWGDIVDLGLRRTRVRNTDGVVVNYPNSVLANSVITNFSDEQRPVRVRVRFQVAYDADVDAVAALATQTIAGVEGVEPDTAEVIVRSVWDVGRGHVCSGILMEGRYRIPDIRARTKVRSRVLSALLADLRAAGIGLALPRVEVRS